MRIVSLRRTADEGIEEPLLYLSSIYALFFYGCFEYAWISTYSLAKRTKSVKDYRGNRMESFHCKVMVQAARSETLGKAYETEGLIPLLFDSFSHRAPAGTRSDAMSVRAIVCRVEPYQIDFQVTLLNLCGADVQTVTNRFGEFRGELEDSGDLELSFLGPNGKRFVILLRGALRSSSGARQ